MTPFQAAQKEAIDEAVRRIVATIPPLTDEQRDQLRVLLDCSAGDEHDAA